MVLVLYDVTPRSCVGTSNPMFPVRVKPHKMVPAITLQKIRRYALLQCCLSYRDSVFPSAVYPTIEISIYCMSSPSFVKIK